MNLIELPESLILDALKQPETGMGYQIAAVLLPSGYRDEGGYPRQGPVARHLPET